MKTSQETSQEISSMIQMFPINAAESPDLSQILRILDAINQRMDAIETRLDRRIDRKKDKAWDVDPR